MYTKKLETPLKDKNNQLYQAMIKRRTKRQIKDQIIPTTILSDILFCACGETKKAKGKTKNKRTIASSCNSQKAKVYCITHEGIYKYLETSHTIHEIKKGDYRQNMCKQPFFKNPPLILIYTGKVSNKSGIIKTNDTMEALLIGTEIGAMSQNVSLYAAHNNLNTTLIALNNYDLLNNHLTLPENEKIIYTQVIGYPKK